MAYPPRRLQENTKSRNSKTFLSTSHTGLYIVVGNVPQRHCLEELKNNETDELQALPMEV